MLFRVVSRGDGGSLGVRTCRACCDAPSTQEHAGPNATAGAETPGVRRRRGQARRSPSSAFFFFLTYLTFLRRLSSALCFLCCSLCVLRALLESRCSASDSRAPRTSCSGVT